jgi:hypothetical protein
MKTKGEDGKALYCVEKTMCCGNRVEWLHGKAPEVCPYCRDKYWQKPMNEYKLFHLQDKFIADFEKTGSTCILGEKMFPLLVEYAENLIKLLLKGKARISPENLYEKANDAATRLVEVILKTPDHRMRISFGGYLKRLCKSEAYTDQENDKMYSMDYLIGDETEFGSTISRKEIHTAEDGERVEETLTLNNRHDDTEQPGNDIACELCGLIGKTASIIKGNTHSLETSLLYLIGLHHKLNKLDDTKMAEFYGEAGTSIRDFVEKGELVVYNHLRQTMTA